MIKSKIHALECTRTRHFYVKKFKNFLGRGTAPSLDTSPSGRGTPRGASNSLAPALATARLSCYDVCDQTKWLIRKKLASWLRIRVPPTPTVVCRRKDSNDAEDFQQYEQQPQPQDMILGSTDKLLMKIFGLLETKFGSKAEDGDKLDEDEEKKKDWQLAAAVVDRILFIIFSIILIGGSVAFFIVFAIVYK